MVLGSHNSWSYLPVRKWWMRPFSFMARCQCKTIREQYDLGVRCFDLRVRWVNWKLQVAHGIIVYDITEQQLRKDLDFLDEKGDCMVRILHETRTKKQYEPSKPFFQSFCYVVASNFKHIRLWCGRNLYDWNKDYDFSFYPTCEEKYASVSCKWFAWWPWLYARVMNHRIRTQGSNSDILLIDYVDIK